MVCPGAADRPTPPLARRARAVVRMLRPSVGGALSLVAVMVRPGAAQERYEVSAERALLRATPSTTAPSLRTLPQGTEVVLLKDSSGWARVRVDATTGYVRRALLIATTPPPSPRPSAVPSTPPMPLGAAAGDAVDRSAPATVPAVRPGSLAEADTLGARAGRAKSVVGIYLGGGIASATVPGLGFLGLLFLHTKGANDLNPSFVERADLDGRSPQYVRRWAQSYDRAATAKQKRALLLGSAVGSVVGIVIYKEVLFKGTPAYRY